MIQYRLAGTGGDGIYTLASQLQFELREMGDTRLLDSILDAGLMNEQDTALWRARSAACKADTAAIFDLPKRTGRTIARCIRRSTGKDYRYALWLAGLQDCLDLPGGRARPVEAYETSGLSLAGGYSRGRLYLYENKPVRVIPADD